MATHVARYKVTAIAGTTVTLQPQAGETSVPEYADKVSQIVLTFATATDTKEFDVTNREFRVEIQRL